MNQNVKNALLFLVVIVTVVVLWNWVTTSRAGAQEIAFSEFLEKVDVGQVEEVLIRGEEIWFVCPPIHKQEGITLQLSCDADTAPFAEMPSVTVSEPGGGRGTGNLQEDIVIVDGLQLFVPGGRGL